MGAVKKIRQLFCDHKLVKWYDHEKERYCFRCVECMKVYERSWR